MKKLSFFVKSFSLSLIVVFFTNSVGYAIKPYDSITTTKCGEWRIDGKNSAKDQRIGVEPQLGSENDCYGLFKLSNETDINIGDVSLGGGYTLKLTSDTTNTETQFLLENDPFPSFLFPGLDINIKTTPSNINNQATVNLQGNLSLSAFTLDLFFFLIKSSLALVKTPCKIPPEQLAIIAIRVEPILENTAQLAFNGDLIESGNELSKVIDVFYEKVFSALRDVGVKCSLSQIFKKTAPIKAKILWAYLTWMPVVIFDYLEYQGQPASITLTYSPVAATLPSASAWVAFLNQNNIWLIHPDGKDLTKITNNQSDSQRILNFKWSPDGNTLAYSLSTSSGNTAILLYDMQTSTTKPLLSDDVGGGFDWSLTGKQIIYDTPNTGDTPGDQRNKGMWVINLDNGKTRQILKPQKDYPLITNPKWSSEGSHVIFTIPCFEMNCVSYGVANFESGKSIVLPVYGGTCEWSPIDLRIACTRTITDNSSGKFFQEIVILDVTGKILDKFPALGTKTVVRIVWFPTGTKLALGYYSDGKGQTDIFSLETGERLLLASGLPSVWSPNGEWILTWKSELNVLPTISLTNINFGEAFFLSEGMEAIWQP
jgi:WD40 repeat protein